MQSKNKTLIPDPEMKKRVLMIRIRNWLILLGIVGAIVLLVNVISAMRRTSTISTLSLPCYAHQDVTVFQDGVLYYDGASIHFVNAAGGIEWSYPVGAGASFAVSDTHMIVWSGRQLFIVNARGKASYNDSMDDTIQFCRIGSRYAAVVTGDELNPVLYVKDLQGTQVDKEDTFFSGNMMLDCGFYGSNDEYLWALSYDVYNPNITTYLRTFQVGQMTTGVVTLSDHLAYKVLYQNSKLNVFTTQHLYKYDYKGVQDVNNTLLVYGWKYLDHHTPDRGNANVLLAPTAQTNNANAITELRVLSGTLDRRYTLPSACVGASISGQKIYAFAENYLYEGSISSQRFSPHAVRLPDNRQMTAFIGLTSNGYAIVTSNNEVYSVSLPR